MHKFAAYKGSWKNKKSNNKYREAQNIKAISKL